MKFILIVLSFYFLYLNGWAQFGQTYAKVNLGEEIPQYEFAGVLNYKSSPLKLSDLKGKLILLDFWGTGCKSCIASWPHLLKIQKEFGEKIQIVLVSPYHDRQTVLNTFEKRKKLAGINMTLPAVYGDTGILKLFPVSGVPHIVWIDKEGKLMSVTYGSSVNSKNIVDILEGRKVTMTQKINNDELVSAEFNNPLFVNGNGGNPKSVSFYSFFGKADERLFQTFGIVSRNTESFAVATNYCLKDMFRLAYSNMYTRFGYWMTLPNRCILDVRDSTLYVDDINGEIQRDNLYTYHLILPHASEMELKERMQLDLKVNTGLKARWVKRKAKCLIFSAADTALITYKGGDSVCNVEDSRIRVNDVFMKTIIEELETATAYGSPKGLYPLVDETNLKGKIGDIFIETDITDYKKFAKALERYKIKLSLEDREIDMLLITD